MTDPARGPLPFAPSRSSPSLSEVSDDVSTGPAAVDVAPKPPSAPELPNPEALHATGLPQVRITSAVDGAFRVSGAGLRAPENTLWDKIVDTLIEIFTLSFANTRTYNEGIDEAYWRTFAVSLAFARAQLRPNDASLWGAGFDRYAVLDELRRSITSASEGVDHVHIDPIMAVVEETMDAMAVMTPREVLMLNRFAADRSFPGRGDLIELLGKYQWTSLRPLLQSERFQQATPREQAHMLATMVDSLDVGYLTHEWPSVDAYLAASRRDADPYTLGEPTSVGVHSFHDGDRTEAHRVEISFPEGSVSVLYPAHENYGGGHMHSLDTIAESLALLPPLVRRQIRSLELSSGDYAYASADGDGKVTLYAVHGKLSAFGHRVGEALDAFIEPGLAVVLAHELGHVITLDYYDALSDDEVLRRWRNAVAEDLTRVTPYGTTNEIEEMAEVFKVYAFVVGTSMEARYRECWGARFAFFDELMENLAQRENEALAAQS